MAFRHEVQTPDKDHWDIPGGYVETGESPLRAAVREVREELGITPRIGRLLAVDWAPNEAEGDKVLYLFDGGQLDREQLDDMQLQADELKSFAFHTPEQITEHTIPRLTRRILATTEARNEATLVYLEHGQRPRRPRGMNRDEAVGLVQRLIAGSYADDAECDVMITTLGRGTGCPHIGDYIFWASDPAPTAETVVDRALAY
ncbi:NUDIX domain-containing protein [Streptomyces sp. NPDC017940]|uniref:NUDIX domain-containing protein n=1 Tax=Streptomyces sp. NPDC017940 TaxID=3365017 RepID=UPI0037A0ADF5